MRRAGAGVLGGFVAVLAFAPVALAVMVTGVNVPTDANADFTYPAGTAGYGTFSGLYPAGCRLQAAGSTVVFTVPAGYTWTGRSVGNGYATAPGGIRLDGGGSVGWQSDSYAAGTITLTALDGGSVHSNGSGGSSFCLESIALTAVPAPSASPSLAATAAPTVTPAPLTCSPSCAVSLVSVDRDRLDLLTYAVGFGGFVLSALLAGVLVTTGLRR